MEIKPKTLGVYAGLAALAGTGIAVANKVASETSRSVGSLIDKLPITFAGAVEAFGLAGVARGTYRSIRGTNHFKVNLENAIGAGVVAADNVVNYITLPVDQYGLPELWGDTKMDAVKIGVALALGAGLAAYNNHRAANGETEVEAEVGQ